MAFSITHLFVCLAAQAWFQRWLVDQLDGVLIGTSFPDIRYPAGVPREQTHPEIATLGEVLAGGGDSPFDVGVRLHTFVDVHRERFYAHRRLKIPPVPQAVNALKALEDEICWRSLRPSAREVVSRALRSGEAWSSHAKRYGVPEPVFVAWMGELAQYASVEPSDASRMQLFRALGMKDDQAGEQLNVSVTALRADQHIVEGATQMLTRGFAEVFQ